MWVSPAEMVGYLSGGCDSFGLGREELSCLGVSTEIHGAAAYVFDAFGVDGTNRDGCCRGTISSYFVHFLSDILNKTRND